MNEFEDRREYSVFKCKDLLHPETIPSQFYEQGEKEEWRGNSLIPLHSPQQEHKDYCIPAVAEVAPVHCIRFSSPPLTNSDP